MMKLTRQVNVHTSITRRLNIVFFVRADNPLRKKNHINNDNTKVCLQGVIIDPIDKTCNIASLIGANDKTLRFFSGREKGHHAVPLIILSISQIVHVPNIFCYYRQVFYVSICLHCKPAQRLYFCI
jgi:hypothetical protein